MEGSAGEKKMKSDCEPKVTQSIRGESDFLKNVIFEMWRHMLGRKCGKPGRASEGNKSKR